MNPTEREAEPEDPGPSSERREDPVDSNIAAKHEERDHHAAQDSTVAENPQNSDRAAQLEVATGKPLPEASGDPDGNPAKMDDAGRTRQPARAAKGSRGRKSKRTKSGNTARNAGGSGDTFNPSAAGGTGSDGTGGSIGTDRRTGTSSTSSSSTSDSSSTTSHSDNREEERAKIKLRCFGIELIVPCLRIRVNWDCDFCCCNFRCACC